MAATSVIGTYLYGFLTEPTPDEEVTTSERATCQETRNGLRPYEA